jgi:hypothetical protein
LTTKQVSFWIYRRSKKEKLKNHEDIKKINRIGKKNKIILSNYFNDTNRSPSEFELCFLASQTSISKKKINYWFQKKRLADH